MKIWTHHCFKSIDESAFFGMMMRAVKGERKCKKKKRGKGDTQTDTAKKCKKKLLSGLAEISIAASTHAYFFFFFFLASCLRH